MKELTCGCTLNIYALPTTRLSDKDGKPVKGYYCSTHKSYYPRKDTS